MGSKKKNTAATTGANLPTLKIGSRVRCTDDGVEGRITWANATAVKIKWDDGEQVTWKRDSLATRPIEILDADGDDQTPAPAATDAAEGITTPTEAEQPAVPSDATATESPATTEQPPAEPETTPTEPTATEAAPATPDQAVTETSSPEPTAEPEAFAATEPVAEQPPSAPTPTATTEPTAAELAPALEQINTKAPAPASSVAVETSAAAQPKKPRTAKAATEPKEKKLSALDAAAKVLAEAGQALNAQELIQAMAEKGYWTSPGGKTPAATIYAAIINEIKKKGADARFVKSERGKFARKA